MWNVDKLKWGIHLRDQQIYIFDDHNQFNFGSDKH